jgi:beta-phosphoglucomutase
MKFVDEGCTMILEWRKMSEQMNDKMNDKIEGVIFDLDGVIVSTDEYHYMAWKVLADRLEIEFDREINNRLRGVSRRESLMIILEKSTKEFSEAEMLRMLEEKNNIYVDQLSLLSERDILPGVLETIEYLKENNIRIAIGSSSKNTPRILHQIHMSDEFDAIVDGNHISKSKPDPEVFIKAAEAMKLSPDKVLVVEDAKAGVDAAINAKMRVLAVGDASNYSEATFSAQDLSGMIMKELV